MFDVAHNPVALLGPTASSPAYGSSGGGFDRGTAGAPDIHSRGANAACLSAALDELDYGIVVVLDDAHVAHVNDAAHSQMISQFPLQLLGGQLRAKSPRDVAALHDALNAARKGLRRLLPLGQDPNRTTVAIVPLELASTGRGAVLVLLGKRAVSESLSLQAYARSNGLTPAETNVLMLLCEGVPPRQVATDLGVAVSTVRTHVSSILGKTGSATIRGLVQRAAVLPPIRSVLARRLASN